MSSQEISVAASPEEVFAVLGDAESYDKWVVGARRIRGRTGDFPDPDARLHHTVGAGPLEIDDTTEVRAAAEPHLLELEANAGPTKFRVRFELRAENGGTRVVMSEDGLNGVSTALARLGAPALAARNALTLWGLKQLVERRVHGLRPPDPPLAAVASTLFGAVARARRHRALHPVGGTWQATATLTSAGAALAGSSPLQAVVRLSRGIGLPALLPDVNGVAVKLVDAHGPGRNQDLLMASVFPPPWHRVFRPAWSRHAGTFSSVLLYDLDGRQLTFVARVEPTSDGVRIEIGVVPTGTSAVEPVAIVETTGPFAGDVSFDPWTTGEAVIPLGFLNALRSPAYAASRAGRP